MNFNKLKTTRLGNVGEQYIPKFCSKHSIKCYQPATDESFPIDSIFFKDLNLYGLECKTKPARLYYPDTGFDTADYNTYTKLVKDGTLKDVCIMFVDSLYKKIWYQWLSKLSKHADIQGNIVYFPLKVLKIYRELSDDEVIELKNLSNSSYD